MKQNDGFLSSWGRRHALCPVVPRLSELTLALVPMQRPELPQRPQASHTHFLTLLTASWNGTGSCLGTSNNPRHRRSPVVEWFHPALEGLQEEEVALLEFNSTCGVPYPQSMCSRSVYKARNAPKRPPRVSCPFGLTGDFSHSKHRSHPTCPVPSPLGICSIIKYHLEEKVPKEAKVKEGAGLDTQCFSSL